MKLPSKLPSFNQFLSEDFDQSFLDKPRKAVLRHPDYKNIVKKVKQASGNKEKIRDLIEDWFIKHEEGLANVVFCDKYEPFLYCEHAAEITGQILTDAGISHWLQVGIIKGKQSHAWAKIGNIIIDPTKDQFPNIKLSDYQKAVKDKKGGWEKFFEA